MSSNENGFDRLVNHFNRRAEPQELYIVSRLRKLVIISRKLYQILQLLRVLKVLSSDLTLLYIPCRIGAYIFISYSVCGTR